MEIQRPMSAGRTFTDYGTAQDFLDTLRRLGPITAQLTTERPGLYVVYWGRFSA